MVETPSPDAARAWAAAHGLAAKPGGSHAGRGTCNLLLGLGGGRYLELLAPDPEQPMTAQGRRLAALEGPRLAAACFRAAPLADMAARLRAAGAAARGPEAFTRTRPDGVRLDWELVFQDAAPVDCPSLFFIDWMASPHPALDLPPPPALVDLYAEHPDPQALAAHFAAIGLDVETRDGPEARWRARLALAAGFVDL